MELRIDRGFLDVNTYILIDDDKNAIIIDPSNRAKIVYDNLVKDGVSLKAVLLTHGHYDHTEGAQFLQNYCPIYIFDEEKEFLNDESLNLCFELGKLQKVFFKDYKTFFEGDLKIDGFNLNVYVMHTPGHTKGSCVFFIDGLLFSGDTLFKNSYGRFDFPTGNFELIKESIVKIIDYFSDDIAVYPGHGQPTLIGDEKKFNGLYLHAKNELR